VSDQPELPADAIAALKAGRKIDAIKLLRERNNYGLKESKEIIDAHIRLNPDAYGKFGAESGLGRLVLIAVISAAIYGLYILLNGF
jgi:hypothetical protein